MTSSRDGIQVGVDKILIEITAWIEIPIVYGVIKIII